MASCDCKILRNIKSGYNDKSPPNDKLIKEYKFKKRWHTLGWNIICRRCALDEGMVKSICLVLSYYKDDKEKDLKGKFILEDDVEIERVRVVDENPQKYQQHKNLLKWHLRKRYDRSLYTDHYDEKDAEAWLKAYENREMLYPDLDNHEKQGGDISSDDDEDDHLFVDQTVQKHQTNDRLTQELTLLRNVRHSYAPPDVSPDFEGEFDPCKYMGTSSNRSSACSWRSSATSSGVFSDRSSSNVSSLCGGFNKSRGSMDFSDSFNETQEIDEEDEEEVNKKKDGV
ncbi:uncharacterized protein [Clytia hemisphaerica]